MTTNKKMIHNMPEEEEKINRVRKWSKDWSRNVKRVNKDLGRKNNTSRIKENDEVFL